MERNVAYMMDDPIESWRHIKSVTSRDSIHVAAFVATGDRYCDKKTILNVTSRLRRTRGTLFVLCDLEQVSDTISNAKEVCKADSLLRYNVVAEYCKLGCRLRMVIEIGCGLTDHKSHNIATYGDQDGMETRHRERVLDASARQETVLLVGDDSFWSHTKLLKQQCRYVVTLCSDSTQVQSICEQVGVTARRKNQEDRWVIAK